VVKGTSRRVLDGLLRRVADAGVLVSTHPDIILKIGTKEVLYTTRNMDWGGDTELYATYEDFCVRFVCSLGKSDIRVLKQYRGSSGDGVFKVRLGENDNIKVKPALSSAPEQSLSKDEFHAMFKGYFEYDGFDECRGLLVNQKWADSIANGMVRCYLTGSVVSGFGYQESIALTPHPDEPETKFRPMSRRFYFSENCGLFQDLRAIVEARWVPQLIGIHKIAADDMPLLWDIDFFINDVNTPNTETKYTLCEINVSGVSPFPPSCADYIAKALAARVERPFSA